MKNKEIFKEAWKMSTLAAFEFGGEKVEYFAEALKLAHKMSKTHSVVKKHNWNFGIIDSYLTIITPNGESYKLQKTVLDNYYNTQSRFLYEAAKKTSYAFTSKEIESIKYLSGRKF